MDSSNNQNYAPSNTTAKQTNENLKGFSNLFFNIIIPTIILNKVSKYFGVHGPLIALIIALLFPLSYGIYDYLTSHKRNMISLLGLINILITGGLALFKLEGIWFAVKEAAIPLVIGLAVLISAFTKKPLVHLLIFNDSVMNVDLIHSKLKEHGCESLFEQLLKQTTIFLALSFFLSSFLNFVLAQQIFTDIPLHLNGHERSLLLNEQIAQMTWKSYLVIALPSLVVTGLIIFYLVRGMKKLTGLDFVQVIKH